MAGKHPATPEGVTSYPKGLFEPTGVEGQEPKFNVTLIFEPSANLQEMKAKAWEAGKRKWPKLFANPSNGWPQGVRNPFRSCAEKADRAGYENEDGVFVSFRASTDYPPVVVDGAKRRITDRTQVYAGCIGLVLYSVYAYDRGGNKGVAFGLIGYQKRADGEPLSGMHADEDDFDTTPEFDSMSDSDGTNAPADASAFF